jgi:hypothetical protein
MDEIDLREEILEQWVYDVPGRQYRAYDVSKQQFETMVRLARMSMIAWNALAGPPRGDDIIYLQETAELVGTRSQHPKTVLRKLIEYAEQKYGWRPTPTVLRAAGRKVQA